MYMRIIVWIIFLIGGLIVGILLDNRLFSVIWHSSIWHIISFIIGVAIFMIVIIISRNTGRLLAKYGKEGEVKKMDTNIFVDEGVYECMRHPMHLGLLMFPFAFAFIFGSVSFILIIAPIEVLIIIFLVFLIEEPEAIKKFGSKYLEYKKKTPFFNFKIYCLKKLFKPIQK